jgi:hypothetical protein
LIDTPGFNTTSEMAVFYEIICGIKAVRLYARITGVMLVTRINDNRAKAINNKLIDFVLAFCGRDYIS